MNITIEIEHLILDGIDIAPGERPALQAALERELGRLVAGDLLAGASAPGGLKQSGTAPNVRGGDVRLAPGGTPAQWGRQIARAVYAGLAQANTSESAGAGE